jgi:hypothetical protein
MLGGTAHFGKPAGNGGWEHRLRYARLGFRTRHSYRGAPPRLRRLAHAVSLRPPTPLIIRWRVTT